MNTITLKNHEVIKLWNEDKIDQIRMTGDDYFHDVEDYMNDYAADLVWSKEDFTYDVILK